MKFEQVLITFEIDEKQIETWLAGLNRSDKNRFVTINDTLVVELTRGEFMLADDTDAVREILTSHFFAAGTYPVANVVNVINGKTKRTTKTFHALLKGEYN